jgi:hypothetical protein
MLHDLFMSDMHPDDLPASDPRAWDRGLSTGELVARVSAQLREGEDDGDELTIIVRSHGDREDTPATERVAGITISEHDALRASHALRLHAGALRGEAEGREPTYAAVTLRSAATYEAAADRFEAASRDVEGRR